MKLLATHICFEVENYSEAMHFYNALLGAAGFSKSWGDDISYTGFVNAPFTVVVGATKPRRVSKAGPTGDEFVVTDHVGFYVPTTQDVFDIEHAMKKAGYEPLFPAQEYAEFGKGFHAVTFCDADNNVIEFSARPDIHS
jgi:catechol 2,3-dioxygenase-like lactoylglutathione lyase family enzyme